MSCSVQSSEVSDRNFVCIPPEEEMVGKEGWEECGKWILVCPELDKSFVDRTWAALQPLLRDGTLLMLKAATALMGHKTDFVQCFVRGGPEEAKRTAGLIRAAVEDYKGLMYYKENKVALASEARRHGYKSVSLYMHTYRGRFYLRDPSGGWSLEEEHGQKDVSIASKFRKENYFGSEELPSTSSKSVLNLSSSSTGGDGTWNLWCTSYEKDPGYLPESDRVWIVARELLGEGYLTEISWVKNAERIEVRLQVPTGSSLPSQLDACDRIFREAPFRRLMYFGKGPYQYKYTPDGELYEKAKFAEKFVLQREQN